MRDWGLFQLHQGDCLDVLRTMADNSVDSVVTDPPLWHPLYAHDETARDALLARAGLAPLPHRSLECNPCVNANRADILRLTPPEVARVSALEVEVGKPMFRPKRFSALGIHGVVMWARHGKGHVADVDDEGACFRGAGCGL